MPSQKLMQRRVLHRERFGPPHDDAVGDDQADEHRQLLADRECIGAQQLVDDDDQRRDDHHLHDHADARRRDVSHHRDEQVRKAGDERQRDGHRDRRFQLAGHRQRRADAENLQHDRVVVEDRLEERCPSRSVCSPWLRLLLPSVF